MEISTREVKERLLQQVEAVARYLLPAGKRKGGQWLVGSINGEAGESLKLELFGPKIGLWKDFGTEEGGDIIDLWCQILRQSFVEAIKDIRCYLSIPQVEIVSPRALNYSRPEPIFNAASTHDEAGRYYLCEVRRLSNSTIDKYKMAFASGVILFPYMYAEKLIMYKYLKIERVDGKKVFSVTPNAQPSLFGWQAVDPKHRSLVITEGEIDAMSLCEYGLPYAILSMPFGGGSDDKRHSWIEFEFDKIAAFEEIYLCLDNDEIGQITAKYLTERFGEHRCKNVILPRKDANQCLTEGVSLDEIKQCFLRATSQDPKQLKRACDFVDDVLNELYPKTKIDKGYKSPWYNTFDNIAFRPEELSIWSGPNGHGKSQMLGHVILEIIKQGAKVCIASLEMAPRRLLSRLTRQASALRLPSPEYVKAIHEWYGDNLWLFDVTGNAKVDELLTVFKYAKKKYGIDTFVIDSLLKCGLDEDDYNGQKRLIENLCDFKNNTKCHIHLVAHTRKATDESFLPSKLDIRGSAAISDLADNAYTAWRNKTKEREIEQLPPEYRPNDLLNKYDAILRCDKQRNAEWEGTFNLWYDRDSFQYLDSCSAKAKPYVPFSIKSSSQPKDSTTGETND